MQVRCPGCDGALNVPDVHNTKAKSGAKMACPMCGQVFRLKAPATTPRRPAQAQSPFEDSSGYDDDFSDAFAPPRPRPSRPRRPQRSGKTASKNLSRWWLPFAIVGGGFAVVSLVVIATVLLFRNPTEPKPNEALAAKTNQPAPVDKDPAPAPFAAPQQPNVPPPEEKPDPPIELPPVQSPPKAQAAGDGQLSADVLKRVKKATVLLRVTGSDGQRASGSGFFAVDKKIVITNAHVVDMLEPGKAPPRKIDIVVDSGEPNERTFAGQVIALDRTSDLAVLKQRIEPPPALPTPMERDPLKVFSAKDLLETQVVYVFGFPFGEKLGKNITVSRSSVSSLRKDKDGHLNQVQVNGGMHPGNSGGPVVDANGNVIGIAVAGIPGTTVNFAIPGDSLYRMLEGRVSGISLGDSRQQGKEFLLPVTVNAIDPLRRLKAVRVRWWVGKPGQRRRPSNTAPKSLPDDTPHQTATLAYRDGTARGTIHISAVPEGKTVYIQPAYQTANGDTRWVTSIDYDPGPLLDLTPVMLTLKATRGESDVYLNSRSRFEFEIFGGDSLSLLSHIDTRLKEDTYSVGRRGACQRRFTVGHMEWGVSLDNKPAPRSLRAQQAMQFMGQLSLQTVEDERGNYTTRRILLGRVPQSSHSILSGLGRQMVESLDLAAVPINGIRAKPGTTWTATRLVPIDTPGSHRSGFVNMTYTYKGAANHFRRRVAVIGMRGVLPTRKTRGITVAGSARGTAYYAVSEHRIIVTEVTFNLRLIAEIGKETAKAKGEVRVKLSRIPPERQAVNPPRR